MNLSYYFDLYTRIFIWGHTSIWFLICGQPWYIKSKMQFSSGIWVPTIGIESAIKSRDWVILKEEASIIFLCFWSTKPYLIIWVCFVMQLKRFWLVIMQSWDEARGFSLNPLNDWVWCMEVSHFMYGNEISMDRVIEVLLELLTLEFRMVSIISFCATLDYKSL